MLGNTVRKDIRTLGYVLKRTNYGEADRILNLITPQGKISAIAKGVRKEKSKLAGGIEMFTLTDFNIHLGRGEFGVVTGAKMMKHYGEIVKDFGKMELAAMMLKKINKTAENSDNAEYFNILDQSLAGLNAGENVELVDMQPPISTVASDFGMTNRRNTSFMAISIFDLPEAFEPYRMPNLYRNTPSATSVTSSEDGPFATKLNSCLSRMER